MFLLASMLAGEMQARSVRSVYVQDTSVVVVRSHGHTRGRLDLADALSAVSEDSLKAFMNAIASDVRAGRGAGYAGERGALEFIADRFRRYGLVAPLASAGGATYFQWFAFHPRRPVKPWEVRRTANVVALWEGTDAELKHEIVVVGAHHDGQGVEGEADMGRRLTAEDRQSEDRIWNAANDNGSGVVGVLELARVLSGTNTHFARSVLFVTFGAEEHGLIGSLYYTSHPVGLWRDHVAMLNLEMIGQTPERALNVRATGTSPVWPSVLESATSTSGIPATSFFSAITNDTDHYGFGVNGVPAVHFGVRAREDYHRVTDEPDRIAYPQLAERLRFILAFLAHTAGLDTAPPFVQTRGPDPGITGTNATEAERRAVGLDQDQGGIKVTAVAAGLGAMAAGLQAGDLIVEINGKPIPVAARGMRLLARAVADMPDTELLRIIVLRNGRRIPLSIDTRRHLR